MAGEGLAASEQPEEPLGRGLKPIKTRQEQDKGKGNGKSANPDANGPPTFFDELHFPPSPVTPVGRVFRKKFFDIYIIAIIGLADPVNVQELQGHLSRTLLRHKRFCSIIRDRQLFGPVWQQVTVELRSHIIQKEVAPDPEDFGIDPVEAYSERLITAPPLDRNKPLWEVHVLSHPRRGDCGGSLVFRIHHALGDGISLMSLFLACSHQTADPTLLPTLAVPSSAPRPLSMTSRMARPLAVAVNTFSGMNSFLLAALCIRDSKTAVKGHTGIERAPHRIACSDDFELDDINLIKSVLDPVGTVNDVLMTVLAGGMHKYLERRLQDDKELRDRGAGMDKLPVIEEGRHEGYDNSGIFSGALSGPLGNAHPNSIAAKRDAPAKKGGGWGGCFGGKSDDKEPPKSSKSAIPAKPRLLRNGLRMRALAIINLRKSPGLQELKDMMAGKTKARWGNLIGYLMIPFILDHFDDPLERLRCMRKAIVARKLSYEAVMTYLSNLAVLKMTGATTCARLVYRIAEQTTLSVSNVVGPSESINLFGSRVVHITPTTTGVPQSMVLHCQSYKGQVKIVCQGAEALLPDPEILCDFFAEAFFELKTAAIAVKAKQLSEQQ